MAAGTVKKIPLILTLFSEEEAHLCKAIPALEAATLIRPTSGTPPPLDQTALIKAEAKYSVCQKN